MQEENSNSTCKTIPKVSKEHAFISLIVNFLLPGIGTMILSCGPQFNSAQMCLGFLQFALLFFIYIGWFWAIFHSSYTLYEASRNDNTPFLITFKKMFGYGNQPENNDIRQVNIDLESQNNAFQRGFNAQPVAFNYVQEQPYLPFSDFPNQGPAGLQYGHPENRQPNVYQAQI